MNAQQTGQPAAGGQIYRVYHLTDTRPDDVQKRTHNYALLDAKRNASRAAAFFRAPADGCEYRLVAHVQAASPWEVLKRTNTVDQHWSLNPEVKRYFPDYLCRSMDTGDVVVGADGLAFHCGRYDWQSFDNAEYLAYSEALMRAHDAMLDDDATGSVLLFTRRDGKLSMDSVSPHDVDIEDLRAYELVIFDGGNKHGDRWKGVFHPTLLKHVHIDESVQAGASGGRS